MPSNFDYSTLLTDDQPDDSGFDYSTLLEDSAGTKTGKAVQRVGDVAISLGKGVIGVPQAITGIADVFTGGEAGKAVEESGVRFKDAQDILSGLQSPEQKAANAEVANADGFVDTAKAAIDNPSTIVNSVAESLPAMGVGGVVARGGIGAAGLISRGLAEKAVPVMAGLGEGAVTAGQIAEQVREENPDGLLTDKQALAAAGAGIVTGGIGAAAAKLVNTKFGQRLGLADMDVLIAKGGPDAVTASAAKTGFIKSMLSSGFSEGVLEELPQSAQEQMWQNYAQGKPITEGVGNAAATGLLAGAAMGAAGGGYSAAMRDKKPSNQIDVEAGNEFLQRQQDLHQGQADQTASNQAPEADPVTPEAPSATPEAAPGITGDVTAAIDRISELEIKASQDGLTPQEQTEHQALSQTIAENLAQENQETPTPEAVQPETQPTGEVQPAESIVPAEPSQPFQPTHTLSDGTPVKFDQEENAYVGADGSLYEPDGYETPIAEAQINTETNPNSGENAPAQAVISQDMANVQPENTGQSGEVLPGNSEVPSQGDTGQAQESKPLSETFAPAGTVLTYKTPRGDEKVIRVLNDTRIPDDRSAWVDADIEVSNSSGGFDKGMMSADHLRELIRGKLSGQQADFTSGSWTIEQRKQNAAKSFMDSAMEQFGLSQDEAQSALDYYQREKLVTLDGITGQFKLKHGPLWESSAIRLAAYQEKFPKASDAVTEILRKAAEAKSKPVRDSYLREAEKLQGATPKATERLKPFTDARIADNAETLARMADQSGWAEIGGQILRDENGNVTGRTKWLPRQDWYAELPKEARLSQADTVAAVNKAINGEPMSAKEKRAVSAMLDHLEQSADNERSPSVDPEDIDLDAIEERQAIIEADQLATEQTDDDLDAFLEASLNGGTKSGISNTELDDIFGPEQAPTVLRGVEETNADGTARSDTAGGGASGETKAQQRRNSKPETKGGDEKGNQGNEQASGGISDKAQRTAELFKANPQKIINGLTSTGKIKQLHDAAGVMTSAGFKDLPMADKVAAYVKMVTGEIIPGEPKPKGAPVETDLFVNSEEERKALEAKQGAANVAAAKDKKRQGDGAEPPPLFSDNAAMAGQVDIEDAAQEAATKEAINGKDNTKPTTNVAPDVRSSLVQRSEKQDGDNQFTATDEKVKLNGFGLPVGSILKGDEIVEIKNLSKGDWVVINNGSPFQIKSVKDNGDGTFHVAFTDHTTTDFDDDYSENKKIKRKIVEPIKQPSNTQATNDAALPENSESQLNKTGDQLSNGQAALDVDRFKDNKIFTADKVAAARERLKAKLGTLNSGFDPELALDGMTIAGAYIESGIKAYADYTKAMIADLGEGVRPYLRSFYESVRAYPGMDKTGMTSHADLDSAEKRGIHHGEMWSYRGQPAREINGVNEHYIHFSTPDKDGKYQFATQNFRREDWKKVEDSQKEKSPLEKSGKENPPIDNNEQAPVIGEQPKVEKQKFNPLGNLTLKQDWGVEHIDGYDSERDDGKGGKIKTEFLNNAKKYLNQVADLLAKEGFEAYKDKKGKTEKPVSVNEGGPAVSGDVSLALRKGNNGIYITVGVSAVRGLSGGSHPQGVAMMARVTNNADKGRHAVDGINQWLPVTASTADLAKWAITQVGRLEDNAKFKEAQDYAKRPQNAEQAPAETGNSEKDRSPWGDSQPDSGQVDSGLAETNQETGNTGDTDSGSQKTSGTRAGSGRVRAPKQLDGRNRGKANSGDRSESGTTKPDSVSLPSEPKADFTATAETAEAITEGGQKTKARANIAAIKLVKQLVAEDRRATMDEQKTLARYVGWGGIKQIFDEDNTAWSSLRTELKNILTAEEYAAANRSILDAHYTGLDVVNGMWGIAKHLGFKGGRLLEPSMGVGNFFGAMPHDMRVNSTMFGVELDNITGAIAKYLYPNARINAPVGFQDVVIPSNSFDFATGNPPFGEHSLYDKEHPEFRSFAIHQFFFAKTLDKLRPGGIQAFVVSRYLMDSRDGNGMAARKYLSENARLVGAMRLPYNAFLSNANTEVVTDIIILQKLAEGEKGNADEWTSMSDINVVHPDGTPSTFSVNKYFADHPEMVLGTHSNTGKMRAKYQYNVEPISGESLQYGIEKATKHLPKDIYKPAEKPLVELATQADEVPEGTKVYGFFVDGDRVMQRVPDSMGNRQAVQIEFKDTKSPERAKGLIKIRDALRDLMRAELSRTADNAELEAKRSKLNQVYDAFVKEHGFVNRDVNRRVMRDDPDYPLLESLEPNYDSGLGAAAAKARGEKERKPTADKADIFRERVLYPFQTISKAETAKDALIASLNEKGGIDQDFMADIYSKPWEDIEAELGELIYQNPAGGYETADAYLAGNVKAKLRLAEEAVKENPAYQRNVEALKAVQPADIPALKISVRLGSPWVDSAAMAEFAKEILGKRTNASIRFVPQIAKWMVSIEDFDPVARVSVWGTQRMPANELLEHILNNKPIVVKDNLGTSREPQWVVNETETESARAKAQDMSAKFKEWIWQDQDRRDRLAKIYNQNYNTDRRRVYDGAHLTLPGSSNAIQLRPHQKNAIWRALQDRTILLDQVVGAGKTFIMAGIAMEMRRLGIARKPMFMVPNSLVRQWRDEFYKLYPNANVLAATENDFAKVNRKRFMAKIATGDWDAVVVAHSSFKKIGMPEAQERKILDDQLMEIADAIEEMKRERGDKNVMRDMQRIKEKLEEKLKALNDRGGKKDDTVSFDELGVDALFTDEAHCFPHDTFVTTDKGQLKIGDIVEKEIEANVLSLNLSTSVLEWKPIIARYNNPVTDRLVKIDHEHGSFTCTANHKIWVNNEYIQAGDIKPGDRVTIHRKSLERNSKQVLLEEVCDQELRSVRGGVQVQIFGEHEQCEAQSLFEQVRGNMENDSREHKVSDCSGSFGRAEESGSEETWNKMPGIICPNDEKQPDEEPGNQREDAPKAVGEDFLGKGRERKDNSTTGNNQQCALLADGACNSHVGSDGAIRVSSEALQSGFGAPWNKNSNRDRWENPQDEAVEVLGSTENYGVECSRVVGITILERGSGRESASSCEKDQRVYCIEVGDNHNFFADGVLVSNCFKNLFYTSGMRNIAGLGNPDGSGRAFDLFVKTQFLAENYSGKAPIVFATGTPVSNSLVEMFTMQRYLAWSKLKDANIHLLDAWAGVYGDVQNVYEVHPSGTGYRLSTRFAKFVNLPSLMNLYRGFADIITMDDLKKQAIERGEKFPVPKVKGGKPTLVVAPRSDLQTRFFGEPEFLYNEDGGIQFKHDKAPSSYIIDKTVDGKYAVFYRISGDQGGSNRVSQSYDTKEEAEEDLQRGLVTPEVAWNEGSILWKFENLKELTKKTNGKINALSITNEARKAGLDYRLINPAAPDFKDSKVNKAVENVLRIHKAWAKDKGTQLVFCDLSVPQSAKAAAASAERDAFVRREGGELKKVKATIAQIDGMDRAFLVVKMGKKEETRFMVYDGVTGADLEIEGATRAEAVKALTDASNNDLSFADKFEQFSPIEDADIADWKDANNSEGEDDEEGDGAISMDELLSMGSTNKFSVYDDIKAKLIKKGIPEKEIAFIHDYNTAVKKGKLFDLVNAGEIRVLIGSTEKMGAGMNVQKRLVGLHHLDAPWRPSDLEQREGRIIRQGNELYKRDPDNFEVEIMRYGTKQTYDTRMWQIIEHKAAGVEQLRKANDDMLEIDDVGGEAANAADMKAAASGNPLILDEIKLRNEVKSLEAQQFGHMQAQVELQDRLKAYKNAPQAEREKMAGIQPLLDIRDKNPAKPFSFIDENGNDHKETKEAEAPITKAMIAVAKGSLGTEMVAGKYRGFDVTFERGGFGVNVDLVTNSDQSLPVTTYGPDDKFSVSGLFTRIENALSRLDDRVNDIKDDAKYKTDQIPAIEKELGKPFAKEEQLKETRAKHRGVVNQLAKSGGGIELTDAMKKELDAALAARGVNDTRLSIGANTAPTPSLVDLFEKMGKRSSKSATINHPQADLIRAIQDGGWQDVLLQVGYEKADKSDNPNGKVFIQC